MVIHCGICSGNQLYLNQYIKNLTIIPVKDYRAAIKSYRIIRNDHNGEIVPLSKKTSSTLKYVLIDEVHRMFFDQFLLLLNYLRSNSIACIFSGDNGQCLSLAEIKNDICSQIRCLDLRGNYELKDKIRTNKELATFINFILHSKKINKNTNCTFENVSVCYANNKNEAIAIIDYFRQNGYVFINYTPATPNYVDRHFKVYGNDFDTHHVIGQEFDKVLMLLDNTFFYDNDGNLIAKEHPNGNYLYNKLFYQGATRVREQLAIVVVEDIDLFNKITAIFRQ